MLPAPREDAERQTPTPPTERPWLFNFLIAPMAVMSMGLVGGALSYLLRREGIDPARGASIVALVTLPHTIYFLWGPVSDFWLSRRNWLMLAATAAVIAEVAAFHQARLSSSISLGLLFLSMCFGG